MYNSLSEQKRNDNYILKVALKQRFHIKRIQNVLKTSLLLHRNLRFTYQF